MSNSKENQHFVPKFYLRGFSYEGNKKQIGLFNIRNNLLVEKAKLKTQAYKKNYYGKDGAIENALSELENYSAQLLERIIRDQKPPKSKSKDHIRLLEFVLLSELRNPVHENTVNQSTDRMIKMVYSKSPEIGEFIEKFNFGFNDSSVFGLSFLGDLIIISSDLSYKLIVNETEVPFITSDNPVVKYNMLLERKNVHGGITGMGVKGIQIFFPLDPNHLILLYDSDSYSVGIFGKESFRVRESSVIDDINILQFLNCEESIFFNDEATQDYVVSLHESSKQFERANSVVITEHGVVDRFGKVLENQSILHSRTTECRTGLSIPFVKTSKAADRYELGNKAVHMRPFVERIVESGVLEKFNQSAR